MKLKGRWHRPATWLAPVYERADGLRVHVGGLVRLPDGTTVSGHEWPESTRWVLACRCEPLSRRRAAMLWASWVAMGHIPKTIADNFDPCQQPATR